MAVATKGWTHSFFTLWMEERNYETRYTTLHDEKFKFKRHFIVKEVAGYAII